MLEKAREGQRRLVKAREVNSSDVKLWGLVTTPPEPSDSDDVKSRWHYTWALHTVLRRALGKK